MTKRHTSLLTARTRILPPIGAVLLATVFSTAVAAADLDVEIRGFSDDIGQAVVQLYASPTSYDADTPDVVVSVPISARVATLSITGLDGTYALEAHHDRNRDGALSLLPFGIPLEPVGYSQGAWSGVSRPDWAHVSFTTDIEPPVQLIRLRTNAFVAFAQMLAVGLPALLAVFVGLAAVRWVRTTFIKSSAQKEFHHD